MTCWYSLLCSAAALSKRIGSCLFGTTKACEDAKKTEDGGAVIQNDFPELRMSLILVVQLAT